MAIDSGSTNGVRAHEQLHFNEDDYAGPPPPEADEQGYRILEQPMGTKRRIKVVLMGAGASSLNVFKKAEEELENVEIVCYEKNHDIGGTWLVNRYPGCACDVPSVNYQFTWKPKQWSHFYSYSPEIWRYLKDIERENDFINKYVRLKHRIERAEWDDRAGVWRFRIRNLVTDDVFDDAAEFFINAGGVLHKWKWPGIPGLHDFTGKLMHSANYEEGYDLNGKKVAVIGAGSSGVQVVAAITPKVGKLYHWIRNPIWVTAAFAQSWAGPDGANFAYTEEQLRYLEQNPQKYLEYRKQIENELNQRFKFIIKGSPESKVARDFARTQMTRKLSTRPDIASAIIPRDFNPGCRRPTPAPGYLEALSAPNATIYTDQLQQITRSGFIDHSGVHHDVDVIICATGFDTTWLPPFPFRAHGRDLRDLWTRRRTAVDPVTAEEKEETDMNVTSYLSIGIPSFPNYFSFCGPYGPLGHGSFMPLIEAWTRYMFAVITKVQVEGIKSLAPRTDAAAQFRQHADLYLQRTAWTQPCSSWFKQGRKDGQVVVYPGSRLHFMELMKAPRYEDFEIVYWNENRFAFLGNGFEVRERDGRDITYYLGLLGDEDKQPVYGEELVERLAGWKLGEEAVVTGSQMC
ncbi:putative sterigmatocystin biosynthesis monooxygenase stcW [Lasiodiplodia hormozganensis]|uniref:Sterigmatocystin biosynthesis monooxygenase stcW n=1 Tax=Lasiodiplodia hormozganensis TaxID=869390 RepID=A0AA39YVJ2_9PEZI|nr:putative sterigmatocystin biosynthesis monooxygenase stcW [Lasiodiplodia hormozganensis]